MEHDHVVDIKGLCCSAPVIRLTKELHTFACGDIILVISDKSSMLNDIPAYCAMTKHELIKQECNDKLYYFWIRKS